MYRFHSDRFKNKILRHLLRLTAQKMFHNPLTDYSVISPANIIVGKNFADQWFCENV